MSKKYDKYVSKSMFFGFMIPTHLFLCLALEPKLAVFPFIITIALIPVFVYSWMKDKRTA